MQIPYVVTCHLYEAKSVEYGGYKDAQEVSKKLLELSDIKTITVSNGMKRKILEDYRDYDEKRLVPILNGTDFKADRRSDTLKKELGIGNKKVLLCVGSIGNRKIRSSYYGFLNRIPSLEKRYVSYFAENRRCVLHTIL